MSYSVLVIFSCPKDQARLRLDREHRYLQKIIDLKDAQEKVRILQATTLNDIIEAVSHADLRVIHFSGHGSSESIYIEKSASSEKGEELDVNTLSAILQEHCPRLEALILSSCYSADGVNSLIQSASKIIAVEGEAGDEAAIEFSKQFYEHYLSG
ncbi:MAG: CHAT domain-containing protein, partial [Candidatus Electrothrix sp. AX5]|nr:CHAT domain-containing protein [Candidatus Electrothrix sp. AX5]